MEGEREGDREGGNEAELELGKRMKALNVCEDHTSYSLCPGDAIGSFKNSMTMQGVLERGDKQG